MHMKMIKNQALTLIQKWSEKLGLRWPQFLNSLKRKLDGIDQNTLYMDTFVDTLKKFGIYLSESEQEIILNGFPEKSDNPDRKKVHVAHVFKISNTGNIKSIYNKIDFNEEIMEDTKIHDVFGYKG